MQIRPVFAGSVTYTKLLNLNKITSNCNKTYMLFMNVHKNGKSALTSVNVLHSDAAECYPRLYLHMSSMISLYLVLTNTPILVLFLHLIIMSFSPHIQKIVAKATRVLNSSSATYTTVLKKLNLKPTSVPHLSTSHLGVCLPSMGLLTKISSPRQNWSSPD